MRRSRRSICGPIADNFCAAIAVIGQESSFEADPVVPGLARIARTEMDKRRESAGIPKFAFDAALALPSGTERATASASTR